MRREKNNSNNMHGENFDVKWLGRFCSQSSQGRVFFWGGEKNAPTLANFLSYPYLPQLFEPLAHARSRDPMHLAGGGEEKGKMRTFAHKALLLLITGEEASLHSLCERLKCIIRTSSVPPGRKGRRMGFERISARNYPSYVRVGLSVESLSRCTQLDTHGPSRDPDAKRSALNSPTINALKAIVG